MVKPCLAFTVGSREWGHNLPGADGTSTAQFAMWAIADTEATALAIAQAVRLKSGGGFDTFQGFVLGVEFMRTFITDESDESFQSADGNDTWTYVVAVEYEIVHRVPMPTSVTQTDV